MQNLDQIMKLLDRYNRRNITNGIAATSVMIPIPPNLTMQETLNIIQEEPDAVAEIVEEELARGPLEDYVGENIVPSEMDVLMTEYHFQPSQINLQNRDYRQIKKYLKGNKSFDELTLDQRTMVESMRYTELAEFDPDGGKFNFEHDGVRFHNLREQLIGRLRGENFMSNESIDKFIQSSDELPTVLELNDFLYPKVTGAQRPGIGGPDHTVSPDDPPAEMEMVQIGDAVPEGRLWMMQDPAILENFANDTFNASYDPNLYNDEVFRSSISRNEHMFLKSQGYDGSWDEYQAEYNLVDEQFEDLWSIWDKKTNEAQLWEPDEYAERTKADPFLEEPPVESRKFKPPEAGEIELTELKPPEFIEKTTPIRPFVDDEISDVLNTIGDRDASALERMISVSQDGGVYLDATTYTNYLESGANLWLGATLMPGIGTLQDLLDQMIPGSSRWINIGLATVDLLASQNPLGLAIQGVVEIINELNIDEQRTKANDFSQSQRGSRYGFFKDDNGDWKPAILNSDIKSTAFGAREQVMSIEFGDKLLFKKDHEAGYYPILTSPNEYMIQEPDWRLDDEAAIPWYSQEYFEKFVPTRRWFFLTPEQENEVFTGATYEELISNLDSFKPDIDETTYPAYTQNILDWQKAITLKEKLKYDDDITEWDPSTGLSRVTTYYPELYDDKNLESNLKSMDLPEEAWLLEEYMPGLIQSLVATQRLAANEAGYLDQHGEDEIWTQYYSKGESPPSTKNTWAAMPIDTHYSNIDGQTSWSANYLRFDRDLPAATSFADLQLQLDTISGYEDTQITKDYLTQKAFTRYFVNELVSRGKGDELYQSVMQNSSLMGEDNADYGTYAMPWSNETDQDSMLLGRDDEVLTTGLFTPYQQKPYDKWVSTRKDNELSDHTWNVNFEATTDTDKEEEKPDEVDEEPDEDAEPEQQPYIYVDGIRMQNPRYEGPIDISADANIVVEDFGNEDQRVRLPDPGDLEHGQALHTQEEQDQLIEYADESAVKTTDWEQAIKMAEIWGKQGMSANPDDYYDDDQNDGTRPEDFVYSPKTDWVHAKPTTDTVVEDTVVEPDTTQDTTQDTTHVLPEQPIIQHVEPSAPKVQLTPFEQYIQEEHGSKYQPGVTAQDFSFIPVTATGESALFGDPDLHDKMNLPDYIKVAQAQNGVIHEVFDPTMVQPAFSSMLPTGHAIEAH